MKPLTIRMVLCEAHGTDRANMYPNENAMKLGFQTGHRERGPQSNHAGRVMGPAQRIIFTLIGLRHRGLIAMTRRRDGLSGTAYALSAKGIQYREALEMYGTNFEPARRGPR